MRWFKRKVSSYPFLEKENIKKILTEKGVNLPCHRCSGMNFEIVDSGIIDYYDLFCFSKKSGLPVAILACCNCGVLSHHSLISLEIEFNKENS